eukprot:TRINITY_DN45531_c0_g1_i1.p1 TRINITY_DN45531_c0_g1~~TRINITY_DN45531_c0_g1_i1.p1  ORF type:complete len:371 (+),score=25.15 TRINITY_DN45531_c0_g1_i1:76-1188(+)
MLLALLAVGWVGHCAALSGREVSYAGFVSDFLCFDKCASCGCDCESCALDKTNVITNPEDHTVHCIRDVQVCIDSGFYLMENIGTAKTPNYQPRFKLDAVGSNNAFAVISATKQRKGLMVNATGVDDGRGTLVGATVVECSGNGCGGTCIGCTVPAPLVRRDPKPTTKSEVQAHGACMLTAWCLLAPLAVLTKRHGARYGLGTRKIKGYPLPFVLHGGMMLTAVLLTIIGASIALARFHKRAVSGHLPIGIAVLILSVWQPLPAVLCRPDHVSPRRKYFNWVHRGGGVVCLVGGAINVFLGVENFELLWDRCQAPHWFGVATACLAGCFVGGILLEADAYCRPAVEPVTVASGSSVAVHDPEAESLGVTE